MKSSKKVATFGWRYNATATFEVMRAAEDPIKRRKFRELVDIKERNARFSLVERIIAHKTILCITIFGQRLIVARTRSVEDQLRMIGFYDDDMSDFWRAFFRRRR